MNALDLMRKRLTYQGGVAQQDRMIQDKRKSLDKAILYSYQGAKVQKLDSNTADPALINPNKTKQDYDDKIISIGYEYGYSPGTVFDWVNTGTKWLIYLQDLTELAYFKGNVRKCSYEIKWLDENRQERLTYAAIRGPLDSQIESIQKHKDIVDISNQNINLLLPATEAVVKYFKRYTEFYIQPLKVGDTPTCWRIEGTDSISMPGILEVTAYEHFADPQQDDLAKGIANVWVEPIPEPQDEEIQGEIFITPKKIYQYTYTGEAEPNWSYDNRLPISSVVNGNKITIEWTTTYSGQFVLSCGGAEKTIVVESLF